MVRDPRYPSVPIINVHLLTVGAMVAAGAQAQVTCQRCKRHVLLDLQTILDRYGPQTTLVGRTGKLKCSACGENGSQVWGKLPDSVWYPLGRAIEDWPRCGWCGSVRGRKPHRWPL